MQPGETAKANFMFFVDVSNSMDGKDRLSLLKSGLKELLVKLNPNDRILLITYSDDFQKKLLYDLIFLFLS